MSTKTADTTEYECGHCTETFEEKHERDWHWFIRHWTTNDSAKLSADEQRAAYAEYSRRKRPLQFCPEVEVEVPSNVWEHVTRDVDSSELEDGAVPPEVDERLTNYVDFRNITWTPADE